MALIKLSGLLDKISGKLGGSVLGTSSNGSYIKQNSFSQQPNSPGQSIQRNKIVQASQAWRSTSQAQKDLWALETPNYPYTNRVGVVVNYNAFQLFQFLNQNNFQNGDAILLSPPAFQAVVNADWLVSYNPANQPIVGCSNSVANTITSIWCAPRLASGVVPAPATYRLIQRHVNTGGSETISIKTNYQAQFGIIEVGDFVWAKFKTSVINNGNTSGFSPTSFVERFF